MRARDWQAIQVALQRFSDRLKPSQVGLMKMPNLALHLTRPAMLLLGTSKLTHAGRAGELGR
jgi:hypothetical protein